MGTVLSLDQEKNMQSHLFPSRDIYGVKIMLSQFSGNLNYFPFVDYKVSRRSALMPIKANGWGVGMGVGGVALTLQRAGSV